MTVIRTKEDAIKHIASLYPIGYSKGWDSVWLETINDFGFQNLPAKLLAILAKRMVENGGEVCEIDLEENQLEEEYENPYLLSSEELDRMSNARLAGSPQFS